MEDLVDRIYEAAFVPEVWPDVLDRLGAIGKSAGGALMATSSRFPPRWVASETVAPALRAYSDTDAWKRNERRSRWVAKDHPGFLRDVDVMTEGELADADGSRFPTRGLGWQIGTVIPMPTGEVVVCSLERHRADGPHDIEALKAVDAYRPHVARAGLLAARLGLERARTAVATLEALAIPAAVLTAGGRVASTNPLFDASDIFVARAHGALALVDAGANALLTEAIESARQSASRSFAVRGEHGESPHVVHVVPLAGAANDIFNGCAILVVATRVIETRGAGDPALLQGLFDLTPAEAKLAAGLLTGASLDTAADALGIRMTTARTHLQHIFRKTGVSQQSQLVRLLSGTRLPI